MKTKIDIYEHDGSPFIRIDRIDTRCVVIQTETNYIVLSSPVPSSSKMVICDGHDTRNIGSDYYSSSDFKISENQDIDLNLKLKLGIINETEYGILEEISTLKYKIRAHSGLSNLTGSSSPEIPKFRYRIEELEKQLTK